jgi:hypothetical protein
MPEQNDTAGVGVRIDWKLEKYDKDGNLVETLEGTDEATPEEAQQAKALLEAPPDKAVEGENHGTD